MIKVLFITGELKHYRVPILNLIAHDPDIKLTVAHAGKPMWKEGDRFDEVILRETKVKGISFHKGDLVGYCNQFDVVVAMFYVQKLSVVKLAYSPRRRFKLIYWGIGVKASQSSRYDSPGWSNVLRRMLVRRSDAMLFYSDYPVEKYARMGIDRSKLFVMHNTVPVHYVGNNCSARDSLIFVGTLSRSKRLHVLLQQYFAACMRNPNVPRLVVVGNGPDYSSAVNYVKEHGMDEKVEFRGAIYDDQEMAVQFSRAIACFSPGQAGLSVLTSMGYGVPFITHAEAYTGGERFNITDGVNGILFRDESQLSDIILDIAGNPDRYLEMGRNARQYYLENRTPQTMADSFIEAVKYVIKSKI